MSPLIGFITDTEGNYDYWCRCVELSGVVCFDQEHNLEFARSNESDCFVFGGDVFDKGPGDIRIASALLRFKGLHPSRVFLLVGNRDANKVRFTAELKETEVDVAQPVPLYPRAPAQLSLRDFLSKLAGEQGIDLDSANTAANRLRWMLDHTMTAKGAFEYRRQELTLLRREPEDGGLALETGHVDSAGAAARSITDGDVVRSFCDSVERDDGFVWRYLCEGQLAVILGNTLFVHAGVAEQSPGWVPTLDMRYCSPAPGDQCGGRLMPEGHTLEQWVQELNEFWQSGLRDVRAQMTWREGDERRRGGEGLLCLTSTPACFCRSIMVESLLQGGIPVTPTAHVEAYLNGGGIVRVLCGHKPCGDSPFVVRTDLVEYVHCDTTFSDQSIRDGRGRAIAAVEIEGDGHCSRTLLRGVLRDGSCYDFALPPKVGAGSTDPSGNDVLEITGGSAVVDPCVGCQTSDGWWVKARLLDDRYHLASGKAGDRNISYKQVSCEEVQSSLFPAQQGKEGEL